MPKQDRIDLALSQLIENTVPEYADDDEASYNQRLDEAYALAHDVIDAQVSLGIFAAANNAQSH
jgi:hypothetical protein